MPINIVALGGSGAGKTLYLASLYKKLAFSHPDIDNSFSLQIGGENENKAKAKRQEINKIWDDLRNDQDAFPAGTIGLDQWEFQCKIKNYNACSFTFVDYAGGLVNEVAIGSEQDRQQLTQAIKEANIILVLLDGIRVIDLLRQSRFSQELITWVNRDVNNILADIKESNTDCPIHFVLTKWDCLVNQRLDNLNNIKNKLLEITAFQQIVNTTNNRKIRLLPVSSLGMNFAIPVYNWQKKFIKMRKTGHAIEIKPYLVEVPLAYALIDSLTYQLDQLEARDKKRNNFVKWFKRIMSFFDNTAEFLPPPYNMLGKASVKVIKQATNNVNASGIIFEDINVANVSSDEQAIKVLVNSCVKTIQSFQDKFPGSSF